MPATELSNPRPLRILVIEDNSDAAETLGDLLRLFGHEAEIALSGSTGVEVARSVQPDVVLCDIGLPGMDGYAVASNLRSEPATRAARLVALTGYGRDSDRQRTREAGFDLHLVKPVEPLELKRLLEEWAKA
jgi:CheY-like chemotaxis protein